MVTVHFCALRCRATRAEQCKALDGAVIDQIEVAGNCAPKFVSQGTQVASTCVGSASELEDLAAIGIAGQTPASALQLGLLSLRIALSNRDKLEFKMPLPECRRGQLTVRMILPRGPPASALCAWATSPGRTAWRWGSRIAAFGRVGDALEHSRVVLNVLEVALSLSGSPRHAGAPTRGISVCRPARTAARPPHGDD